MNNIPNIKIGLLKSGRLINEVVVDELNDVYIGIDLDNTIVVNIDGFYQSFPLFKCLEGKYYLNIFSGISGKMFHGEKVVSLDKIQDQPDAVVNNGITTVPLPEDVRGMLFFDNHTLLFKVYPFEPTPKSLPREFRGGLFTSDFDFTFFTIFSVFLAVYIGLAYSFGNFKPKNDEFDFQKIPERFARLVMDKPVLKEIKEEQKLPLPASTVMEKDEKKVAKDDSKNKAIRNKGVTIASKGRISGGGVKAKKSSSEIVRSAGIIGIIGSKGRGGTVANLFQESGFSDKLNKALKGVSGLRTGLSVDEAKIKRGSGDAKGVDIGSLKTTTGAGLVAFGDSNAGSVNILGTEGGEGGGSGSILGGAKGAEFGGAGSMSPAVIVRVLSQHVSAFQYCYNKALKNNPRLSGELKVKFVILLTGDVSKRNIGFSGPASNDANLTSCVQRVFTRIKFPNPKGGEVLVNYPLHFMAQN